MKNYLKNIPMKAFKQTSLISDLTYGLQNSKEHSSAYKIDLIPYHTRSPKIFFRFYFNLSLSKNIFKQYFYFFFTYGLQIDDINL